MDKRKLTVEQMDKTYLHLLCAALTGLTSRADLELAPKELAQQATEIADHAMDYCVTMHEAHLEDEADALVTKK